MSSIEKSVSVKDVSYFARVPKCKSIMQKTTELKKINKFRYSRTLDSKLITITKHVVKLFGIALLAVFMFVVIYYSSVEFINMKYGSNYEQMYSKPETGAEKYRAIPNIREQAKIRAERQMIFNKIIRAIEHLE